MTKTLGEFLDDPQAAVLFNRLFTHLAHHLSELTGTEPSEFEFAVMVMKHDGEFSSFSTIGPELLGPIYQEAAAGLIAKAH